VFEPFAHGDGAFAHGVTFGGHPVCAAVALANIDVIESEGLNERVREHEGAFRAMLDSLRDIPIVGDVRGMGYFHAIELVKDRDTKEMLSADEGHWLLDRFLSSELVRRGLICRADDRGEPVIQLSPPLIAGPDEFAEMEAALRPALEAASTRLHLS
jgi:adenosylmethionine-8-amino-7-oxononanoate aminotransferase